MAILLRPLLLALVLAIAAIAAVAQAAPKKGKARPPKDDARVPTGPTSGEIDQACDQLVADKAKHTHRWFAQVAVQSKTPAAWTAYANDAELKARLKGLGAYELAETWRAADGALYVEAAAKNDAEAWTNLGAYCFRSDGSLARAKLTSTFMATEAPARVTRVEHYAADGRLVRARSDALRSEHDAKVKIYKTTSELPFASLLH
jgi:hypothetical protein